MKINGFVRDKPMTISMQFLPIPNKNPTTSVAAVKIVWQQCNRLCDRLLKAYPRVSTQITALFRLPRPPHTASLINVLAEWEGMLLNPMCSSTEIQKFIARHTKNPPTEQDASILVEAAGELLKSNRDTAREEGRRVIQHAVNTDWPELRKKANRILAASPQ